MTASTSTMFSEARTIPLRVRVATCAKKLECPVDEDANYENTYVCAFSILSISFPSSKLETKESCV